MLRAAIAFFVIALLAMFLGANNIAGLSADVGRTLLWVFVVLAVISFIASLVTGRRGPGVLGVMLALSFGLAMTTVRPAHAEETNTEKVVNGGRDSMTSAKKHARNTKKHIRDATGNHSATEDMKDSARNAKDDVTNSAKKAKDKVD